MAMYSIELRRYIESFSQYGGTVSFPLTTSQKIEKGRTHLFDFEYPFFDESKRKEFETKWIKKFYMTEIGFETIGQFKLQLDVWLNENMPYYNQRFESELIKFDPLKNTEFKKKTDLTKTGNRKDDFENSSENGQTKDGSFHTDIKDNGKFDSDLATDEESKTSNLVDGTSKDILTGNSSNDGSIKLDANKTIEDIGSKKGNNLNTVDTNNFNRHLDEDTPDGRLDITTEDGNGIIRYASKIGEDKGKNHSNEQQNIDESTKKNFSEENIDNTTTKNAQKMDSTNDGTVHSDAKGTGENHLVSKTKGNTENSGFQDGITKEELKGNVKGNSSLNQSTDSSEFFNEEYVGKIGVETYSEMIMKYRETFLRIEKEIYEECRRDLFMLVY